MSEAQSADSRTGRPMAESASLFRPTQIYRGNTFASSA